MRLGLFGFIFLSLPLFAQEGLSFKNDREGKSFYTSASNSRAIQRALKDLRSEDIVDAYRESLAGVPETQVCAYDVNERLLKNLRARNPNFVELPGAIYQLRSENEIDDVVVKILINAIKVSSTVAGYTGPDGHTNRQMPKPELASKMIESIAKFPERLRKGCFDEAYLGLYGELSTTLKNVTTQQLDGLYNAAYEQGKIDAPTYAALERARLNKVNESGLTLKSYFTKKRSLRTQFPLRDPREQSHFATEAQAKTGLSRRQRLYESYTDIQIMLMANVVKKLRARLDSPKIEILVYDREKVQEVISLEPMERFRFAIKILRKEMSELSLNSFFSGRTPEYVDLMTASYEIGLIPASEVDEVASLQDVWNPQKTFWEKSMVWVRTFGAVLTVVVPPPYGFVPALAIVAIEATVQKNQKTDPTGLF